MKWWIGDLNKFQELEYNNVRKWEQKKEISKKRYYHGFPF